MSLVQKVLRSLASGVIALAVAWVLWMLVWETGLASSIVSWWQWHVVEPAYDPNDMLREIRWWAFPSVVAAFGIVILLLAVPAVSGLLSLLFALAYFGVITEPQEAVKV